MRKLTEASASPFVVPAMHGLTQRLSRVPELLPDTRSSGPGPVRFSLDRVPERERRGVYREFIGRSVARLDIETMRDAPFEADFTLQSLPGLQLISGRVHGSCNRRTRELLADGQDDFTLAVNLGGPYVVSQGGGEIVLGDGEATLASAAEPCSFTHYPPGDFLVLRFPRAQFTPLVTGADDCCLRPIPRATQALRLLTDYVGIAWDEQTIASRDLQHLIVAHIYDLMAVAIGATRDAAEAAQGRGVRAARLQAIKKDIAENLDQADLSVATLAARHGCTPRFIQRLFEAEGVTFTEYVLTQRLARARRMLTDPCRTGDKITTIALDAGFADVSYFNRAFRQHYGETPSGVRGPSARHA
jgi:AraC-like DNA-binding protein